MTGFATTKELDEILHKGCANPECECHNQPQINKIELCAKCHPTAGVKLWYYAEGFLGVYCGECGQRVMPISVQGGELRDALVKLLYAVENCQPKLDTPMRVQQAERLKAAINEASKFLVAE